VLAADIFCKLELLRWWWWYVALGDLCQSFCSSQKEKKKNKQTNNQFLKNNFCSLLSFVQKRRSHVQVIFALAQNSTPLFHFLTSKLFELKMSHIVLYYLFFIPDRW
jgi:hypothetical protein